METHERETDIEPGRLKELYDRLERVAIRIPLRRRKLMLENKNDENDVARCPEPRRGAEDESP